MKGTGDCTDVRVKATFIVLMREWHPWFSEIDSSLFAYGIVLYSNRDASQVSKTY